PTARMQYTAASFAGPLTELFRALLRPRRRLEAPRGLFPAEARLESATPDVLRAGLWEPVFRCVAAALARLRWLQPGLVQVYVLYIALALVALLFWTLA
ncbi:MAG: hypothetical protein HY721_27890, partial [Planctomycetes bacterium]|nr:hypothetical protein [Planctomycetota bacterium]